MVSLTPEEEYVASAAQKLLEENFGMDVVKDCFNEMKKAGILVKNKSNTQIRGYTLSNRQISKILSYSSTV
jgi:hypothetical protein